MRRGLVLGLLAACAPGVDTATQAAPPCDPCALTDADNYSYQPDLIAPTVAVAPGEDLQVSWAELEHDLLGAPLDPRSLDLARVLVFPTLGPDEVLAALARDNLSQAQVTAVLACTPADAACHLSDFNLLGNNLDVQTYLQPGSGTWLIVPARSTEPGAASLIFLDPQAGVARVGRLSIPEGAARLTVAVDLVGLDPTPVAEGARPTLDWSALTVDALGNAIERSRFDRVMLARFEEDLPTLERRFLEIEGLAADLWEQDVTGATRLSLADLDGFDGFSAEGTWLLGIRCSTCQNPAPRFLTVLDVIPNE